MGELYRAAARERGPQLLPCGLDPFRRHGDRPPEACGEPGLSDSETLRQRGGGIESVPQIDKVYVALEEDVIHWCAGLRPRGEPLCRHPGEQALGFAEIDRDLGVEDRKSTRLNSSHVETSYAV